MTRKSHGNQSEQGSGNNDLSPSCFQLTEDGLTEISCQNKKSDSETGSQSESLENDSTTGLTELVLKRLVNLGEADYVPQSDKSRWAVPEEETPPTPAD